MTIALVSQCHATADMLTSFAPWYKLVPGWHWPAGGFLTLQFAYICRYTPTLQTDGNDAQLAGSAGRSRPKRRAVSAGRLAKEHEMLQNLWVESHGRKQQQTQPSRRACRRSSSVGSSSRTLHIIDRATGTTYRRGRLLGKVSVVVLKFVLMMKSGRSNLTTAALIPFPRLSVGDRDLLVIQCSLCPQEYPPSAGPQSVQLCFHSEVAWQTDWRMPGIIDRDSPPLMHLMRSKR